MRWLSLPMFIPGNKKAWFVIILKPVFLLILSAQYDEEASLPAGIILLAPIYVSITIYNYEIVIWLALLRGHKRPSCVLNQVCSELRLYIWGISRWYTPYPPAGRAGSKYIAGCTISYDVGFSFVACFVGQTCTEQVEFNVADIDVNQPSSGTPRQRAPVSVDRRIHCYLYYDMILLILLYNSQLLCLIRLIAVSVFGFQHYFEIRISPGQDRQARLCPTPLIMIVETNNSIHGPQIPFFRGLPVVFGWFGVVSRWSRFALLDFEEVFQGWRE